MAYGSPNMEGRIPNMQGRLPYMEYVSPNMEGKVPNVGYMTQEVVIHPHFLLAVLQNMESKQVLKIRKKHQ